MKQKFFGAIVDGLASKKDEERLLEAIHKAAAKMGVTLSGSFGSVPAIGEIIFTPDTDQLITTVAKGVAKNWCGKNAVEEKKPAAKKKKAPKTAKLTKPEKKNTYGEW